MVRYLLKQDVVSTIGVALRANYGSMVTQQVISNVLTLIEQLRSYAQVYFPGTGGQVGVAGPVDNGSVYDAD